MWLQKFAKMCRYSIILLLTLFTVPLIAEEVKNTNAEAFPFLESINYCFSILFNSVKSVFKIVIEDNKNLNSTGLTPEDTYLNIKDLTSKYGYDLEEHKVQTEDGYILTLHRIPKGRKNVTRGILVFLMHGILDSSDAWVLQGPGNAPAYILADEGYDVWMGNARGNKHSSAHIILTTDQAKFWKFSWEEIGLHDLPSMIDYILNLTQLKNLYYIGHSQGTTSFYVMMSMKPDYNDKVKMAYSLSPVAYMGHVKSPIVKLFSPANGIVAYWLSYFNTYSSSVDFFNKILSLICYVVPRCDNLLYLVVGNNHKYVNESLLPVVFSHMPSGSSTLQFVHYGQLVESGRFCRYDFGADVNKNLYKNDTPPEYELSSISAPVVLFYSGNDWLSDPRDVDSLVSKLPNVIATHYIEDYNHLDFLYAINAKDLVYYKIINHINKFEFYFSVTSKIRKN